MRIYGGESSGPNFATLLNIELAKKQVVEVHSANVVIIAVQNKVN